MKKTLIIGNWKMYVDKPEDAKALAAALKRKVAAFSPVEVVVAPPFPLIATVAQALALPSKVKTAGGIRLGAQSVSAFTDEKHTGDVSAAMLKRFGVSYVIVGHSERRAAGESDEMIAAQIVQAQAAGLTAVLCIGETEQDATGTHFSALEAQLRSALSEHTAVSKLVVAYEPVWAIGKTAAEAMQPAQLRETSIYIRKILVEILGRTGALRVPVLYGGSVEGANAAGLLSEGDIAGFLVGHASVDPGSFSDIILACRTLK